ncbi:hypothetical protein B0H14DRAFT_2331876 [Mycena olivaceomarginata]|nr:hypothetical protein B0H14DRAFT_2331876 [Mycena olivaceomarginata]
MRIAKIRVTGSTATSRPIHSGHSQPSINKGRRAGQHVRIQVLSGMVGWAEIHPFTIASQTNGEQGLVLM